MAYKTMENNTRNKTIKRAIFIVRLSNGLIFKWWSKNWTENTMFMVQNVRYSNGQPSHVTSPFEYRTPNSLVFSCLVLRWLLCLGIKYLRTEWLV